MLGLKVDRDTLLVCVHGDLDLVVAKEFKESVDEVLRSKDWLKHLMVDLSEVKFIDSSGLGVIIGRYKLMRARQGQMALCGVGANVYRILELAGIKKLMPILKMDEKVPNKGGRSSC